MRDVPSKAVSITAAAVVSLNALAAAAIIGRHGPLFHYRRKVAPVESEVSLDCVFKLYTSR